MLSSKPPICFVSPGIYPVFAADSAIELVGGAEVQQSMLARVFQRAGYPVSIVTLDYGQPDGQVIDGVTVYRAYSPGAGYPGMRFFHPRATGLWAAMRRANAQLYYQRGCGMLTGIVGEFCRRYAREFVFSAASDADFFPQLPLLRNPRDRWLYRRGLRQADFVVVQSPAQQRACLTHFRRRSAVVGSCCDCPPDAQRDRAGHVLWVANMRRMKRPDLLLELAGRLPGIAFRVVGGKGDQGVLEQFAKRALAYPNVTFAGYRPYAEMEQEFNRARVLVNTSEFEGFPNTFLQAWAHGIPVVSFFDVGVEHDGKPVVQVARDIDAMAVQVAALMSDDLLWSRVGDLSRDCHQDRFTPDAALCAYQRVLGLGHRAGAASRCLAREESA